MPQKAAFCQRAGEIFGLAAIAEKNNLQSLAHAFHDPSSAWRNALASNDPLMYEQLISLEILALNAPFGDESDEEAKFHQLMRLAGDLLAHLVQAHSAGEPILLMDDHHRRVWSVIEQRHKEQQKNGKTTR